MTYQYKREPLSIAEADGVFNAAQRPQDIYWDPAALFRSLLVVQDAPTACFGRPAASSSSEIHR